MTKSKKQRSLYQKLANKFVSLFVFLIIVVPIFLTIRWAFDVLGNTDSRKVSKVPSLQVRAIDTSAKPIEPFKEGIISITFDDGWESVYTQALVPLQQNGLKTTQYIISGSLDDQKYMSVEQIKSMQIVGHEIGSHTVSHADLTTLDDKEISKELQDSKNELEKDFGPIKDFTSPLGAYNKYTLGKIGQYYRSQKNAEGNLSSDISQSLNQAAKFEMLNLRSYSVRNNTSINDIQKLIDLAITNKAWLILTYHQIDYTNETFSVTPDNFRAQIKAVSAKPIRSATVGEVLDNLQKAKGQ